MAQDKYFFDKRTMRRILKKYGIIFLICIPFLLLFNIFVGKYISNIAVIGIDVLIGLVIIAISEFVIYKTKQKQEEKINNTKQKTKQIITMKKNEVVEINDKNKK